MNQEYFISLISKSLSGPISEAESTQLKDWVADNSENALIKKRIEDSWKNAGKYKSDIQIDENAAWKKIASQLKTNTSEPAVKSAPRVIPIWKKPLSIAATLLLLVAGTWFFMNNSGEEILNYSTANNETKNFVLPDGSKVTLNENSKLSFDASNSKRNLNLNGEGFFEVTHDKSKPFIVNANKTTTTVLGTVFNVNANDKEKVEVTLIEGKVSFEAPNSEKVILAPNEKVNYIKGKKVALTKIQNENTTAWKTKKLNFKNTKITTVIETINQYFDKDVSLVLKDSTCLFTGSFDNPDYKQVLEVLKFTYDLNIENKNSTSRLIINKCK